MKIKNFVYAATLLAAVAFSSCSNETEISGERPASKGNTVSFRIDGGIPASPVSRATAAGNIVRTPALEREQRVSKIHAVAYKAGAFHQDFIVTRPVGSVNYQFDILEAGTFDVYLLANPDAELVAKLGTDAKTPQDLAKIIAKQLPGEDNKAKDFLLTSEKFTVTTQSGKTTDAGVITLTRAAARFDLYNRISGLKMTKVTFKNRPVETRLATPADMSGLKLTQDKTYEAAQGLGEYESLGAIYSYENTEAGSCTLTLEGTFNGKAITPHDIVIEGMPVKRNHLYSIIISREGGSVTPGEPGKLKFEIVVNDWNEGATLEWKDDNLVNRNAPNFTVSGEYVKTTPAASGPAIPAINPTVVTVGIFTATDITVSVTADASSGSKLEPRTALPTGYSVTPGAISNKDGKLTQEFTIHLPENNATLKVFDFVLVNAFAPEGKRDFTVRQRGQKDRPKMAIEYMAEYNVGETPGVFATSNANDQSGYYYWTAAKTASPTGYHLPTKEEWVGIVPDIDTYVSCTSTKSYDNVSERITVKGDTKTYTADYRNKGNGICYALKFKGNGNTMLAAYRYENVGNFALKDLNSHFKITVRYLGDTFAGTVSDIDKESFWTSNNGDDVSKILPACGLRYFSDKHDFGNYGMYWSQSPYSDAYHRPGAWSMRFSSSNAWTSSESNSNGFYAGVRPFSDN